MRFDPQTLAAWTKGHWTVEPGSGANGFAFDARRIRPGQIFFALTAGARDGHDFVEQAKQGGAIGAVVERALAVDLPQLLVANTLEAMGAIGKAHRRRFSNPVIGITGSSGKTSTKEMLLRILGPRRTHGTAGNWNNLIGVPMTLFGLDPREHDYAVVEAGINQRGEMAKLGDMISPNLSILTQIGPAHLEELGSLEGVAREKAELARAAAADAPVVLPAEALGYAPFAAMAVRVVAVAGPGETPARSPAELIRMTARAAEPGWTLLTLDGECLGGEFRLRSRSSGMVSNAALAAVAAAKLGVDAAQIRLGLEAWRPEGSRGGIVQAGERTFYVDCYNANPASMRDAFAAFTASMPESAARCYVLGAMNELGADSAGWHRQVTARLSPRPGDMACFVGPPALTEAYAAGAREAGWTADALASSETADAFESLIAAFKGAVFLKGSRSYALERLVPTTPP